MAARQLPVISRTGTPQRAISFVTVRYSGDYEHNLAQSACVHDPLNELIVVDNRGNLGWATLGEALAAGMARARNDLVVLVHEDVLLLPGWQCQFEWALSRLEAHDPDWHMLGVAGWDARDEPHGHWSDPHDYHRLLGGTPFAEVDRIDEHLMVLRRRDPVLDPLLPSIHNIGMDLARSGRAVGRRTYVIDAPTVHKFADANGRPIQRASDSTKIQGRTTLTYKADKSLSDDYFREKWAPQPTPTRQDEDARDVLDQPFVMVSRGGGGSRLLSQLAMAAGIHLGEDLGGAGDSLGMVQAIYRGVLGRYRYPVHARERAIREIREAARRIRDERPGSPWGFKLPESMLVLDEIQAAFPRARFVHLVRDPVTSCLRRSHMTARLDNQIGQAVVRSAYLHLGIPVTRALSDPDEIRMAVTTVLHFDTALPVLESLPPAGLFTLRFEDLLARPADCMARFAAWKERHGILRRLVGRLRGGDAAGERETAVSPDPERATRPLGAYSAEQRAAVATLVGPVRRRLGYQDR